MTRIHKAHLTTAKVFLHKLIIRLTITRNEGCLVLIPDSKDIRAMKQQSQQQQAQLTAIRHTMRELMAEYISG